MTLFETIGMGYVVLCTALASVWFGYAVYQHTKRTFELKLRGEVEERRDVIEADKVRNALVAR